MFPVLEKQQIHHKPLKISDCILILLLLFKAPTKHIYIYQGMYCPNLEIHIILCPQIQRQKQK